MLAGEGKWVSSGQFAVQIRAVTAPVSAIPRNGRLLAHQRVISNLDFMGCNFRRTRRAPPTPAIFLGSIHIVERARVFGFEQLVPIANEEISAGSGRPPA